MALPHSPLLGNGPLGTQKHWANRGDGHCGDPHSVHLKLRAKFCACLFIPFPNHSCLGAKPQTMLQHGKAKQQRHG